MKKTDLVEIKKNNIGTGLLIEQDGYASLPKSVIKEHMSSEDWHVPYPFVVDAVFQKYGVKNANGRIYPKEVLMSQVEKYQDLINQHLALGECYTPDVLILTESGWKQLSDVTIGENILTLNTDTNEIEIKPILRKIEKDYDGDLIHLHQRTLDELVTPKHEYIVYDDHTNKYKQRITAENILEQNPCTTHLYIPKLGKWNGKNDEYFEIPALSEERLQNMHEPYKSKYSLSLKIPMNVFAAFMGIYLSEGCCGKEYDKDSHVMIYQKKKDVCNKIKTLLDEFPLEYTVRELEDGYKCFNIYDIRLCNYLHQFGTCYNKFVPFELKQQKSETLQIFYDWFVMGDGRIKFNPNRENQGLTSDVFSTSKQLSLDLNEIQLKIGYSGNFHTETRNNDRYIKGRLIEGKNSHPMYFSLKSRAKSIHLDKRFLKSEKVAYKGKVMCVEVENHSWYVMSNGKCHWTSNCNHPDSSTIDLGRVSHNIIELHWEGCTLVGKLELNLSQGFVKHGICSTLGDTVANLLLNGYKIGVSSRGVGSVEQKMGQYIVGTDFDLICWDIVSSPSTPNAYIGTREELEQYIESENKQGTLVNESNDTVKEKISQIRNILNS